MIPGPDIIIACPKCSALAKVFTLTTGNTLGATLWTDGKLDAPMLPRPPEITKCRRCDAIYWVPDAKRVGEYSPLESADATVDPAWREAPRIEELTEDEYYQAIDAGLGATPEKERHLRLVTWWCTNDSHRVSSTSADPTREERCLENMRRLVDLLDPDEVNDRIMKAELARELGNFAEAIELATAIDDKGTDHVRSFLLALCHEETTAVKPIPERRMLDWIDGRPGWQFVAILYGARWIALVPIMVVSQFVFTSSQVSIASMPEEWRQGTPIGTFLGLVVVPPLLETLFACTLPYWVIARVRDYRNNRPKRCWGFVAVSAGVMAVLHPMAAALLPALTTGAFLAYCYAHFAPHGVWKAILATTVFHAAINMVGWTLLMSV